MFADLFSSGPEYIHRITLFNVHVNGVEMVFPFFERHENYFYFSVDMGRFETHSMFT